MTRLAIALERAKQHGPNTPRERDANGKKVDEPVQCAKCLQFWPCDIHLLSSAYNDLVHAAEVTAAHYAKEEDDKAHDDSPVGG